MDYLEYVLVGEGALAPHRAHAGEVGVDVVRYAARIFFNWLFDLYNSLSLFRWNQKVQRTSIWSRLKRE